MLVNWNVSFTPDLTLYANHGISRLTTLILRAEPTECVICCVKSELLMLVLVLWLLSTFRYTVLDILYYTG